MQEIDEFEQLKLDVLETLDIIDIRLLNIQAAMSNETPFSDDLNFTRSCFINLCATLAKLPSQTAGLQLANQIMSLLQRAATGSFNLTSNFVTLALESVDELRESITVSGEKRILHRLTEKLDDFEEQAGPLQQIEIPSHTRQFLPESSKRLLRALVIEPSADELHKINAGLATWKFEITTAQDGAEGIMHFLSNPEYDLVLVNLQNDSAINGHTFIEVIERLYQKKHIPRRARCIVYSDKMTYQALKALLENECVYAVRPGPIVDKKLLETVAGALSYRGKLMTIGTAA